MEGQQCVLEAEKSALQEANLARVFKRSAQIVVEMAQLQQDIGQLGTIARSSKDFCRKPAQENYFQRDEIRAL